jgi:hypothetical protein
VPTRHAQNIKRAAARKQQWLAAGHGEYREAATEKDFFAEVKAEERVVCHFYRDSLPCKVVGMTGASSKVQQSQMGPSHGWHLCARLEHPTNAEERGAWSFDPDAGPP